LPSSKTKTVLLVIAAVALLLIVIVGIGVAVFLHRATQPLAGPVEGPAPDIFSLVPSDAPVVAYLDAKSLRTTQNSSLQAIGSLLLPTPQQDPDYTEFVRNTGFDYSRDLDRAALGMWPTDLGASGNANAANDDRTVAIAEGRFDQQRIKTYALRTGHVVTRGSKTIYEVPGNPPVSFEFLSDARVEIASGKDATDLLVAPPSTPRDPAMQSRIDRVAGAPLFAVARTDKLPDSVYDSFKNSQQLYMLVRSVQAITLAGQPRGNNLAVTLDGECDSMKNSIEIGTLLDGFRMIGSIELKDPKARGQMTAQQAAFFSLLLDKVKVTPQDKWVRLSIDLTPAMLAGKTSTH
jgi:hypothetical protein